ncbi:MAG: glutamate-5-semialdehyde dehydrogenase [Clostridia bacterium]|nr:glutamate-5-semialdehyde dehydrogenase [Clostridia bacterium]MBP5648516.1 glutamate-5-semialdehyde dehydrogenase [Clostridia bacterium]
MTVVESCKLAKDNAPYCANLTSSQKNKMLYIVVDSIINKTALILEANKKDIDNCKDSPAHIIDRLRLTPERIQGIADGVKAMVDLEDPIGKITDSFSTETGLKINKVTVPLGVVGIIYEARPNVTVDVISICIKTGNAVVLRGSGSAIETNKCLVSVIKEGLTRNAYNPDFIQIIEDTSHEASTLFMQQDEYVDVLIPRGSGEFIKQTKRNATIPVIETGAGNCHIYIEKTADYDTALNVLVNGKLQRQSVCNALESILIDNAVAEKFLPGLLGAISAKGVEIHGCEKTSAIFPKTLPATDADYYKEYLGPEISCKVVENVEEAINHVNKYSTHHSEAIITNDKEAAAAFLNKVDSACVYLNASTRFTDGYQFGFGGEMGISTQKLHARGPIGPAQLVSYKYQIIGSGQIRK